MSTAFSKHLGGAHLAPEESQGKLLGKAESTTWQGCGSTGWEGELDQRFPSQADQHNHLGQLHDFQAHPRPTDSEFHPGEPQESVL